MEVVLSEEDKKKLSRKGVLNEEKQGSLVREGLGRLFLKLKRKGGVGGLGKV